MHHYKNESDKSDKFCKYLSTLYNYTYEKGAKKLKQHNFQLVGQKRSVKRRHANLKSCKVEIMGSCTIG